MPGPEGDDARLRTLVHRLGLAPEQEARLRTLAEAGEVEVQIFDTLAPSGDTTPDLELPAPPPTSRPPDLPDRIGPFPVLARLGEGGMGEVLRVVDPELGRTMALKLLRARRARAPGARSRFLAEARATARLQHPGIVPIHAMGQLEDGRLWYTMEEVRGRTLRAVIEALHHATAAAGTWARTVDGWTLRRLVEALYRSCQAVGYAHAQGVVHRDIKPANIMVGQMGELRVLDWGVAKLLDTAEDSLGPMGDDGGAPLATRAGVVVGTPAYMAPEQAQGDLAAVGPWSDVHALGVTLFEILAGAPPAWSPGRRSNRGSAPRAPLPPTTPAPVPDELVEILLRATALAPADRYADATAMAEALAAWLEGARRRDRALELVQRADAQRPRINAALERVRLLEGVARDLLLALPAHAPIAEKRVAWQREDEARDAAREAREAELEYQGLLRQAIEEHPDLSEARDRLSDLHRQRHAEAEAAGQVQRAAEEEALLRRFGARRHARYLAGEGTLTLVTEPPGARVRLLRHVERDRRLVPEPWAELGPTPVYDHPLPIGSYLCELEAPGHATVRYPVHIRRREHWDGIPPGAWSPAPIALPTAGALGPDEAYVPAGWFWSGARDPSKQDSLPWRRLWLDAFVIRRYHVTNREYLAFLDDLLRQGREEDAALHAPHYPGTRDAPGALIYGRRPDGGFKLVPDAEGDTWGERWPVLMITVRGAEAYARWEAQRTGLAWQLPGELQWEKAARGVDGRAYPWGDHPEPTYANLRGSRPGHSFPAEVGAVLTDRSPYGVHDAAGNACDLCRDDYRVDGPPVGRDGRVQPVEPGGDRRTGRGGAWSWPAPHCRLDYRTQHGTESPRFDTSFRLVRPLTPGPSHT